MNQFSAEDRKVLVSGLLVGLVPAVYYHLSSAFGLYQPHGFLIGYGLGAIPFVYLWPQIHKMTETRTVLMWLMAVALLTRLVLLTVPPVLSEDLWRYIWDGMIQWSGNNPYSLAPLDPKLDAFTHLYQLEEVRSQIGHGHIPTIYPPAGQVTFAVATVFGPHQWVMRLVMIGADLLVISILWKWAQQKGKAAGLAALYAFMPLCVFESSVGGHLDSIGVAFLVTGLYTLSQRKYWAAVMGIVLSIGSKLVPLVLLAYFLRRNLRAFLFLLLGIGAMIAISLACYATYPKGLVAFAHHWRGNDSFFALIYQVVESSIGGDSHSIQMPAWFNSLAKSLVGKGGTNLGMSPEVISLTIAKCASAAVLALVSLWAFIQIRSVTIFWTIFMGTLLLVSPMVHPWYLLWVLPFCILHSTGRAKIFSYGFILWSLLAWLAYWPRPDYLVTGVWTESTMLKIVQYLPVWVCTTIGLMQLFLSQVSKVKSE